MSTASMLVVFLSCTGQSPGADRPPPLTFDKPVDYVAWYNELVQRGKKNNAFDLYKGLQRDEEGKGGMPAPEGAADEQLSKALQQVWKSDELAELRAYLQKCAPYVDTLRKAVQRTDYWQPAPDDLSLLVKLQLPSLGGGRAASKAILAQALMKQDRQGQAVSEACQVVLQHAGHMQQQEMVIGELVGVAERIIAYQTARVALADKVLADDEIVKLYGTLRRFDVAAARTGCWPQLEWAVQLDVVQYVFPEGKFNAERWNEALEGTAAADRPPPIDPAGIDGRATAKQIDNYFEGLAKIVAGPLGSPTARTLEKYEQDKRAALQEGNAFLKAMLPSLARAYQQMVRGETHRRGTLLALALCGHHAEHGKWPDSLAAIDAKLGYDGLDGLRQDPLSGKEFVYKVNGGQPLLYSVGVDGKDDGGKHDEQWSESKDYVFWPYQRP